MGMRLTTPESEIKAYIDETIERINRAIIYNFQYVGERCVNVARQSNAYKDRTGNLRSSIGYVIVKDGKVISESPFQIVKDGQEGKEEGQDYAKKLAKQYPEGITLIVVAGMDYAAHVASKGKDVVDSAELLADRLVPQFLSQLGFR